MFWILAALALIVIAAFFFSALFVRRMKQMPRILMLHSLSPRFPDLSAIKRERFDELLAVIAAASLRCGRVDEALADHRCVALTFDDGYDDLQQLAPLLRESKLTITVLVPTACIGAANTWDNFLLRGKRRHLSAEQIRALAALGVQFGSHGHSHRDLTSLSDSELKFELLESRRILTALSDREVTVLAFPFGRYDRRVLAAARAAGYRINLAAAAIASSGDCHGRIAVNALDSSFTLRAKLRGSWIGGLEILKAAIISRFSALTPLTRKIL